MRNGRFHACNHVGLRDRLMMTKLSDDKACCQNIIRIVQGDIKKRRRFQIRVRIVGMVRKNTTACEPCCYRQDMDMSVLETSLPESNFVYCALPASPLAVSLILIPAASVMVALIFQQAKTRRIYSDVSEKNSRRYT